MIAAVLCAAAPAVAQAGRIERVVVVLLDDVGVDKIGAYGLHPTAGPTPTIDALARQGVIFTSAYSDPVCSPTRCAALTGLYGSRTGIGTAMPHYNPEPGEFAPSDALPWLPRVLARNGLRSWAVGKWHLTHEDVPGFQQHAIRAGFRRYAGQLSNLVGGQTYFSWEYTRASAAAFSQTTSSTYVSVQEAADGLAALHDGSRFTWLCFNAPHKPWDEVPPAGLYTPVDGPQDGPVAQQYVLEAADTLLGLLIEAWATEAPAESAATLWIVMGDNGTPLEAVESPWPPNQHKSTVFQGGVHVPLIASGAGVAAPGRACDHLVHAVDLWATVLELLEVPAPAVATDSRSFAPVIARPEAPPARDVVYVRTHEPNGFGPYTLREHAATDGRWKLIERKGSPWLLAQRLYDLGADPFEQVNLWPPSTPEEVAAVALLQPVLAAGNQTTP